jgi:hypothetical protein
MINQCQLRNTMSADQQDLDQHAAESGWQPQPQPPVQPKKRHRVRTAVLASVGLVAAASVIGSMAGGSKSASQTDSTSRPNPAASAPAQSVAPPTNDPGDITTDDTPTNDPGDITFDDTPAEKSTSTPAKPKPKPSLTVAQENAIGTARDYLDYDHFSRQGLIDQLKFEGFSKKDATFAVDHITVNWNKQAVGMAKDYLDYDHFSRQGLIDQLEYEGFTHSQAVYGVDRTGL